MASVIGVAPQEHSDARHSLWEACRGQTELCRALARKGEHGEISLLSMVPDVIQQRIRFGVTKGLAGRVFLGRVICSDLSLIVIVPQKFGQCIGYCGEVFETDILCDVVDGELSCRDPRGHPALSMGRILATALRIAGKTGVYSLSMQSLTQLLDSDTATLYRSSLRDTIEIWSR